MVIKSYATLGFISMIDNHIANTLPQSAIANMKSLNKLKLKIGPDHNSYSEIFKHIKSLKLNPEDKSIYFEYMVCFVNIVINVWIGVLINFQKILFNYLVPFMVLIFQLIGYHSYAS